MSMLQISNYHKSYDADSRTVLKIPALTLDKGVYWLKGENGSGKTTLLKSIAGLIPFEGNIAVEGKDIRKQRIFYRKIVNWAEAEPVYPGFLTGNDLLNFYHSTKGGSDIALKELTGIEKFLHQKTGAYSSGMTKKLSLLLAFTGQPKLIILDEPLITLDAQTIPVVGQLIRQFAESGVSFLVSSHQAFDEWLGFAPTVLTIHQQTISRAWQV